MKNSRRRAREFALQAIYQWLVNESPAQDLLSQLQEQKDFAKADAALTQALVHGVVDNADALRELIVPLVDRKLKELSPIEHAVLLQSAFELRDQPQTPYRVIINEGIELAKIFGGTDGHKYINGVLDKLAMQLRPDEVRAPRVKSS
ncbi:MAG TPA: transcription antitermination factor NusB [Burkholderiales bacterium]|nr:transcription antitermination factor NusB [Burkholderiales bacterium]